MIQSLLMESGVILCQGESTGRGLVICLSLLLAHIQSHTSMSVLPLKNVAC